MILKKQQDIQLPMVNNNSYVGQVHKTKMISFLFPFRFIAPIRSTSVDSVRSGIRKMFQGTAYSSRFLSSHSLPQLSNPKTVSKGWPFPKGEHTPFRWILPADIVCAADNIRKWLGTGNTAFLYLLYATFSNSFDNLIEFFINLKSINFVLKFNTCLILWLYPLFIFSFVR